MCSLLLLPFKANLLPGSNVVPPHPNFCHTTYVTNVTSSLLFLLNKPVIDTRFIAVLRGGNLRTLQSSYSPGLVSATKGALRFGVPKNEQVP